MRLKRVLALTVLTAACGGPEDLAVHREEYPPVELLRFDAERGEILCVALSPDGKWVAAGSSNDRLRVFDVDSGELASEARGHRRGITCVAFSPDGARVVTAGPDRKVRVWTLDPLVEERALEGPRDPPSRVAFSADGTRVEAVSMGGEIFAWDAASGAVLASKSGPVQRSVSNVDLAGDGGTVAWASDGGRLRVWDVMSGAKLGGLRVAGLGIVQAVAVDRRGELMATCERDARHVDVFDLDAGLVSRVDGLDAPARTLHLTRDGRLLVIGTLTGLLCLFDVQAQQSLATLALPLSPPRRLSTDQGGLCLAAAGPGSRLTVWDVSGVALARSPQRGSPLAAPLIERESDGPPRPALDAGVLDFASLTLPDYDPPELRADPSPLTLDRLPAVVRSVVGVELSVRGYPLASEVHAGQVRQFLLSRFPPGCCFGSVPVIDEWIEVRAPEGTRVHAPEKQVEVRGVLEAGELLDSAGCATSIYRMRASGVLPVDAPATRSDALPSERR